jgi:hypothetical protein
MGRPKNSRLTEKELANLKPCKPGETHNPNGRPKKLVNAIKGLPKDMQEQIYGVLAFALTLPDEKTAKKYLEQQQGELGKYGFVLQIAIKQLTKDGWGFSAMMDIMDRLYGKPRISAEVQHSGGITLNIQTDEDTKDMIEGGLG